MVGGEEERIRHLLERQSEVWHADTGGPNAEGQTETMQGVERSAWRPLLCSDVGVKVDVGRVDEEKEEDLRLRAPR